MNRSLLALAGLATLTVAVPAAAHHSAAIFDFRNPHTSRGRVKDIEVVNPHTHMKLSITDAKGTRDWVFEGHSASNFYRAGYTRGSVNPGDEISITYAPMRDGSDGGYIVAFTTKAGTHVGFDPPG